MSTHRGRGGGKWRREDLAWRSRPAYSNDPAAGHILQQNAKSRKPRGLSGDSNGFPRGRGGAFAGSSGSRASDYPDPELSFHGRGRSSAQGHSHSRRDFNNRGREHFDGGRGRSRGYNRNHGTNLIASTLPQLITQDPDEVIIFLTAKSQQFEEFLGAEFADTVGKEQLITLVQLIAEKLCVPSNLILQRNPLIAKCCLPSFLNHLKDFILDLLEFGLLNGEVNPKKILGNLYHFAKFVSDKMPSQSPDQFLGVARNALLVLPALKANPSDELECDELDKKFQGLKLSVQEYKAKREDAIRSSCGSTAKSVRAIVDMERRWRQPPPNDFRSISVVPTTEELLSENQPFLRPSLIQGKYPSAQDYLDTHFRLLREDFVEPIRQGIKDYFLIKAGRMKMSAGTVKVYYNVQLLPGLNFETHTPYHVMKLDYENNRYIRKVKWNKSKRLMAQSLVLFSGDKFQTIYFATICRRDETELTKDGKFGIIMEGKGPPFSAEAYFDLIECDVYFEAYRHTLTTLKGIEMGEFPMAKYILDADSTHRIPSYIQSIRSPVDFSKLMTEAETLSSQNNGDEVLMREENALRHGDIRDTETWPSADDLGMDGSQFRAFSAALTREISIIQGPPGTGKTFIAIQIAKFLLSNRRIFFPDVSHTMKRNPTKEPLDVHLIEEDGEGEEEGEEEEKEEEEGEEGEGEGEEEEEEEEGEEEENGEEEEETIKSAPVLVVCYTNHALDQFLEAVCQIMVELEINPKGNLVRVGFQTKSEQLKHLTLHKQYLEAKNSNTLPFQFQENLRRAKGRLGAKKYRRFDLIHHLRNLKELPAILDLKIYFALIGAGNLLADENTFLRCFQEMANAVTLSRSRPLELYLGLQGHNFSNPNYSSQEWMRRILGPRIFRVQKKEVKFKSTLQEDDEEGEDKEDCDLDELMANRMNELDFEMDIEFKKRENIDIHFLINPDGAPYTFRTIDLWQMNQYILKEKEAIHPNRSSLAHAKFVLGEETFAINQKFKTIKDVVRRYNEKSLTLPVVGPEELQMVAKNMEEGVQEEAWKIWAIYFQLLEKCKKEMIKFIVTLEDKLVEADEEAKETQNSCYAQILKQAMFVGMTTTGAAKYNSLLPFMQSRLVIVEEAAEVLESHIITCLTKHCEQLILIGDHKQLRPKTAVYKLAKQYNLDISLFERMINNNLNLYPLEVQHRMRPEICELIVPTIYEKLENHSSVSNYPSVKGMVTNMFFISHKELEYQEDDSTSKSNHHEAKFLVRLCRHLLLQGYTTDRITILTTYIGQMFLIKGLIREAPICQGVRVTVVDNFQGEENDIILLSLVRSNEENKIGFLGTENRICVTLSRAKHGFFVIGNMVSMATASVTWTKIIEILERNQRTGEELFLKCEIHGEILQARTAADFDKAPEGGCSRMCEARLEKCGHICPRICHAPDKEHADHQCRYPCQRKCEKYGHACPERCYRTCPRCTVRVDTFLKCGHSQLLECYIDAEEYKCHEKVNKTLPCYHKLLMQCWEDPMLVPCRKDVKKKLPCDHSHTVKCFRPIEEVKCTTRISIMNPACQHPVEIFCHEKDDPRNWKCLMKCDTRLLCGHSCVMNCHPLKDPDHENYKCQKECARKCENGHECSKDLVHKHKCHSKCPNCKIHVHKALGCGHDATLQCFLATDPGHVVQCEVPTTKKSIDCPHEIKLPCYQIPAKFRCTEPVLSKKKSPCGHSVEIPCNMEDKVVEDELASYCQMPCGKELFDEDEKVGCRHTCEGSCSTCFRGKLHQKCGKKCERVLFCGHVCKSPCSAVCPPCQQNCDFKCEHSKCKQQCGKLCSSCKEPCAVRCSHSKCRKRCGQKCDRPPCNLPCTILLDCGHRCVGLCSESCPKLCRICNNEELTEVFLGHEDEPEARYTILDDCGHTFEVSDLDKWMAVEGNVDVKKCPKCKTAIRSSKRYKNVLKEAFADVIRVKEKIFGNAKKTYEELLKVASGLEKIQFPRTLFFFAQHLSTRIYKPNLNPFLSSVPRNELYKRGTFNQRAIFSMDQYELESLMNILPWCEEAVTNISLPLAPPPKQKATPPPASFGSIPNPRHNAIPRPQLMGTEIASTSAHVQQKDESKGFISGAYRTELENKYVLLLTEVAKRTFPFSRMEIIQFSMEFQRLSDLFQLYRRYSVDEFEKFNVKYKCEEVKDFLLGSLVYNKGTRQKFAEMLKEVDGMMKISWKAVSRETLQTIFTALDAQGGSWHACPEGHLYQIGDCGNPAASSICPDCKAAIGANGYHVAARGNYRVANHRQHPTVGDLLPTPDFLTTYYFNTQQRKRKYPRENDFFTKKRNVQKY